MKRKNNYWREQFPLLQNYPDLVYLDTAATAQKPQITLQALQEYYSFYNANIHRSNYDLADQATDLYEKARVKVAKFMGAKSSEVVFTAGATDSLNQLADSFRRSKIFQPGDQILVSVLEHHANFLVWQRLAQELGLELKIWKIDEKGELEDFQRVFNSQTKLLALTHCSNVTGYVPDLAKILAYTRQHQIISVIDGAQMIPHHPIDLASLDCDFYVFSAHKMYGPTGLGVLFARGDYLDHLEP
nr:aminotransferase class V-fold PLP-dependent enzyme [Candidatus Gracilibacteria bacterium]